MVAQGDTLIVVGRRDSTGDSISSVTDSAGNTYTVDVAGLANGGQVIGVASGYMATALSAISTVTIHWTGVSAFNYFSGQLTEYSGLASSNWTDKVSSDSSFHAQIDGISS